METHTEISRPNPSLFSAEQIAKAIGTDLETINEWLDVGAVDRAVFGEEGIDLGKIYDYDIILLDLNLPDMSGFDVLRKLRQQCLAPRLTLQQ